MIKYDNLNIWFTSDTHFWHTNIIKYCERPFSSVEEMNEVLIKNWNDRVGKDDIIYHLGDFAFGGSDKWINILEKLNGKKHLIKGNHDPQNVETMYSKYFESISDQQIISVGKTLVYLNHFPFLCYAGAYHKNPEVYQFFGHVHSRPKESLSNISDEEVKEILGSDKNRLQYLLSKQYDVGVDNNNYAPISFKEIINKINYES